MRAYKEALQQLLKNRLLNFRAEHGYSQEKIAELLHISPRALFDLESGKYGFSALTLMFFLSVMEEKEVQKLLREFRRIVDEENEILVFSGGSVTVPERAGYSLSVLALSDRCTGVSIRGTKYELEDVTVENSFPIGVSNQWRGTAEITVEQGVLAVIESKM